MNDTETTAIKLEQYIPHPPHKVWRALTEPALLARWWVEGNIAPAVGHEFKLDMASWGMQPCTVLEVQHEAFISYTFGETWTLTWRLEAEGEGTRLYLTHDGFDLSMPADRNAFDNMAPGWSSFILPRLAEIAGEL